jgi:hypothetical protein
LKSNAKGNEDDFDDFDPRGSSSNGKVFYYAISLPGYLFLTVLLNACSSLGMKIFQNCHFFKHFTPSILHLHLANVALILLSSAQL